MKKQQNRIDKKQKQKSGESSRLNRINIKQKINKNDRKKKKNHHIYKNGVREKRKPLLSPSTQTINELQMWADNDLFMKKTKHALNDSLRRKTDDLINTIQESNAFKCIALDLEIAIILWVFNSDNFNTVFGPTFIFGINRFLRGATCKRCACLLSVFINVYLIRVYDALILQKSSTFHFRHPFHV